MNRKLAFVFVLVFAAASLVASVPALAQATETLAVVGEETWLHVGGPAVWRSVWDWGDGTPLEEFRSPTGFHTWSQTGVYDVSADYYGKDGFIATHRWQVTVCRRQFLPGFQLETSGETVRQKVDLPGPTVSVLGIVVLTWTGGDSENRSELKINGRGILASYNSGGSSTWALWNLRVPLASLSEPVASLTFELTAPEGAMARMAIDRVEVIYLDSGGFRTMPVPVRGSGPRRAIGAP